ncbi:hypothetical protein CVT26_012841 [Gymnopilus dilepis]|uniref:F-box domain-containing protein n=1 Tax=Gymnopilus dilepis TaxID=231916 RepID=A0A409Y476_9AGAR|nr:hypothetical protein CVT26_012841 [Gymnopilus dilepis]
MPSSIISPQTSVSALSEDTLLRIFLFNADMSIPRDRKRTVIPDDFCLDDIGHLPLPNPSALMSTINASHVCRDWRRALISSPKSASIWGRLLDFNTMHRPDFIEEIWNRAGNMSPLSISGTVSYPSRACQLVFKILKGHWHRMENIAVYVNPLAPISPQDQWTWNTISKPAPKLRTFTFSFMNQLTPFPVLLTDHAPALRVFRSDPSAPLSLTAPWLSRLTHLGICGADGPPSSFGLPALLGALSHMPQLHTLELLSTKIASPRRSDDLPTALRLHGLQKFIMHDRADICFAVLRQVDLHHTCVLVISSSVPDMDWDDEFRGFHECLEGYLKERFYNDRIFIDLQPTYAFFTDGHGQSLPPPTTEIRVHYRYSHVGGPNARTFFDMLAVGIKLNNVKDLELRLNIYHNNDQTFRSFFACLTSVRVLKTTVSGMQHLLRASPSVSHSYIPNELILLPQLHRLRMIAHKDREIEVGNLWSIFEASRFPETQLGPLFVNDFRRLFRLRRVPHLDVRNCFGDLTELDSCTGLRVTWKDARDRYSYGDIGEYICGTGNGPLLDIPDPDN